MMALGWCAAVLLSSPGAPAVAFHYGAEPPWAELSAFDVVVLDAGQSPPEALGPARPLAYVALGETHPTAPWADVVESDWVLGQNPNWGGYIMDLAHPGWRGLLLEQVLPSLVKAGFRGFFFDAVDSHLLLKSASELQEARWDGLVELVSQARARFPELTIFVNRGFERLEALAPLVDGVVAESLFGGWDPAASRFVPVTVADREWLDGQLQRASGLGCTTIVVDYRAAGDREQARADARAISALGHVPWVSTPGLDRLGVGAIEVHPREVWLVYDGAAEALPFSAAHRFLALPLEYLGLVPRYVDVRRPLPAAARRGEVAGVVTWLGNGPPLADFGAYRAWLRAAVDDGVPVVFFGVLGEEIDDSFLDALSAKRGRPVSADGIEIAHADPSLGFEAPPRGVAYEFLPLWAEGEGVEPLFELRVGEHRMQPILLAPWGGWALQPYFMAESLGAEGRWVVDPFDFLRRALKLPSVPVVDSTTESGRRVLLAHIDGDGAASLVEGARKTPAITAIRRWLERHPFPHTVSVVEGELSASGLNPELSPRLEEEARRIFRLPHVEPASHGYAHPFEWAAFERGEGRTLPLSGVQPSLQRELLGSLDYVEALAGRRPELFLWTGDALPGAAALQLLEEASILNLNGGFTVMTDARPSVTHVAPSVRPVGGFVQVYAPILNENVFTNGWTGPYWGYRRVVETFERTGRPRRLKPIGLYYHFFSATRLAGRKALARVYADALRRKPIARPLSSWVRELVEARGAVVAQGLDGRIRLRRAEGVRTLRAPEVRPLDLIGSRGVAGARTTDVGRYLHLVGQSEVELLWAERESSWPALVQASARVRALRRSKGLLEIDFEGLPPVEVELSGARCRGRKARRSKFGARYLLRRDTTLRCRFGGAR